MGAATRRQDALDTTLAHCVRIKSLLSTSDGKDKVMSLMQYACMTVSGGADGDALRAQKSIASARKPFRVFKPVEAIMPVMAKAPTGSSADVSAQYAKALGMCAYFGFDHLVWLTQAGVQKNAKVGEVAQKLSYWGWFAGSAAALFLDTNELNVLLDTMKEKGFGKLPNDEDEDDSVVTDDEEDAKREAEKEELRQRARKVFVGLITNSAQSLLALALLEKIAMSKRKVGMLGVFLSAVNIATLLPPIDLSKSKTKTA